MRKSRTSGSRIAVQLSLFGDFVWDRVGGIFAAEGRGERRSRGPLKSDEELKSLWLELRKEYFPERSDLDDYCVTWSSRRRKRTLAVCHYNERSVSVARELRHPESRQWLSPLLYHEMCHAVLGCIGKSAEGRRVYHGPVFRKLESRHPGIQDLDSWIASGGWLSAVRSDRARNRKRVAR